MMSLCAVGGLSVGSLGVKSSVKVSCAGHRLSLVYLCSTYLLSICRLTLKCLSRVYESLVSLVRRPHSACKSVRVRY